MPSDPSPALAPLPVALLDDALAVRLADTWATRCEPVTPSLAVALTRQVLLCLAADAAPSAALVEAAAGLGVLRARQGHDAAALVEDLLGLRPLVEELLPAVPGAAAGRLSPCLEQALRAAVSALVAEHALPADRTRTRDVLTGLLSRTVLLEALEHEVASATRYGAPTLVVVDLDGLTRLMEVHGQLAADLAVLRAVEVLRASSRRSDVLGRLGVDQVAVVLPRTDLPRALVVARRVLARTLADGRAAERERPGTAATAPVLSVAAAWLPAPQDGQELLEAAEAALQRARQGGGRVVETNRPAALPAARAGA